ncbi:MAG: GNAT family N-acetyltransferase, partial [Allorhizobium sp.]
GGAWEAWLVVHRCCGFEMAGRLFGTVFMVGLWLDTVFMQKSLGPGNATTPDLAAFPGTLA